MRTDNLDLRTAIAVLEAVKDALKSKNYHPLTHADTIYFGNKKRLSKSTVFSDTSYVLNRRLSGYHIILTKHRIETRYYSGKNVVVRNREEKQGQITLRWSDQWPDTIWVYF